MRQWNQGSAIETWVEQALQLIVKYRHNPLRAGRSLTLVSVAMHDALVSALRLGLGEAGQRAELHSAASRTLSYLFPSESAGRLEALGFSALSALATAHGREAIEISQGAYIGERVAALIMDRAMNDGADDVWDARQRPAWAPWRAKPPWNRLFRRKLWPATGEPGYLPMGGIFSLQRLLQPVRANYRMRRRRSWRFRTNYPLRRKKSPENGI